MCIDGLHGLSEIVVVWFGSFVVRKLYDSSTASMARPNSGELTFSPDPLKQRSMSLIRILFILTLFPIALQAGSIVGNWRTIDDVTGKTKSIVKIYKTDHGDFEGLVSKIIHSDLGPNPVCEKCKGERHNQPIEGMVILWGLEQDGEEDWKGGEILDPKNGKIYKAKLHLREDGKLEVRGFIGFALIGRTQVWEPAD